MIGPDPKLHGAYLEALALRKKGWTYSAIGKAQGISGQAAKRRVWRGTYLENQRLHGVPCPQCLSNCQARPSILLPGQLCRMDGYIDPREREIAKAGRPR